MPSKIWRYMDMTKFISLLVNEALYFACPLDFEDPFEGHFPKSFLDTMYDPARFKAENQQVLIEAFKPNSDEELDQILERFSKTIEKTMPEHATNAIKKTILNAGVSCWYKSDYESDAMWKLYASSNQCIAIESTIEKLRASIKDEDIKEKIIIDDVQYLDFEKDLIDKSRKNQGLFMKRKAFEHENELRALIYVSEAGKGKLVNCRLNTLIESIHLSPLSKSFIQNDVEALLQKLNINKPVIRSKLLEQPSY
jgi:hypothetical protein